MFWHRNVLGHTKRSVMIAFHSRFIYVGAGAASGALWFGVALLLDAGWAIPRERTVPFVAAMLCGSTTGILIALLFQRLFHRAPTSFFLILPLATLPVAIMIFAVLLWGARQLLGVHLQPSLPALRELRLILETYFFGGLFSVFMPILLLLALATQYAMRFLLKRAA